MASSFYNNKIYLERSSAPKRFTSLLMTPLATSSISAEVWVCPVCRRMELRYPAELPLPETAEEQQARRLELRMNQYPADKLRHMAADPALTEEERAAAARVLSRRS